MLHVRGISVAEPNLADEEAVLRVVESWPRDRQLSLVRRLLDPGRDTLDPATHRPIVSSASLRGLLTAHRLAPSDEEVDRWREEKYQ
jgi:hypothetical protein